MRPLRHSIAFLTGTRLALNTAFRFVYPFLPAVARGLGVSLEQAGLLVSARSAAAMATPLVVASAGGRGEHRGRLIGLGLTLFVLGASVTAATGVYAGALVGFVLLGLAKPAFDVSARAYVADRTAFATRGRALSVLELTWSGALLVGAPAAGWLIDRFGWRAPFWALAGSGVLALILLRASIDRDAAAAVGTARPLRLDRSATALLAVGFLISLSAEITFVPFGAWLEEGFGLSLVALGGAATLIAVAELTGEGATLAFTDRLGKRRSVALGIAISMVAFASVGPASGRLGTGLAVLAIGFFGFEISFVAALPLATEVAPRARVRYLAVMEVAFYAARATGAALGPWLFARGGFAANTLTAAGADLVALVLLMRFVRE